jgi:hypothetical protein
MVEMRASIERRGYRFSALCEGTPEVVVTVCDFTETVGQPVGMLIVEPPPPDTATLEQFLHIWWSESPFRTMTNRRMN